MATPALRLSPLSSQSAVPSGALPRPPCPQGRGVAGGGPGEGPSSPSALTAPGSAPRGAGTARLLSESCPGGFGGAEGWKLNRERELRKKEEAREGINSIQLANGKKGRGPRPPPSRLRVGARSDRGQSGAGTGPGAGTGLSPRPSPRPRGAPSPARESGEGGKARRGSPVPAAARAHGPAPGCAAASPLPRPRTAPCRSPNDIASIGEEPGGGGRWRG